MTPKPRAIQRQAQTLILDPVDYANDAVRYAREVILWGRKSDRILVNVSWR